jgi:hypothetical protein
MKTKMFHQELNFKKLENMYHSNFYLQNKFQKNLFRILFDKDL